MNKETSQPTATITGGMSFDFYEATVGWAMASRKRQVELLDKGLRLAKNHTDRGVLRFMGWVINHSTNTGTILRSNIL